MGTLAATLGQVKIKEELQGDFEALLYEEYDKVKDEYLRKFCQEWFLECNPGDFSQPFRKWKHWSLKIEWNGKYQTGYYEGIFTYGWVYRDGRYGSFVADFEIHFLEYVSEEIIEQVRWNAWDEDDELSDVEIQKYIDELRSWGRIRYSMLPDNKALFDLVCEKIRRIEPYDTSKYSQKTKVWLWTENNKTGSINKAPSGENSLGWFSLVLDDYDDDHAGQSALWLGNQRIIDTGENDLHGYMDLSYLLKWMDNRLDKILEMLQEGTYNDFIKDSLPYRQRSGYIKRSKYWEFVPEDIEESYGKISEEEKTRFINTIKYNQQDLGHNKMCLGDYFKACKIIYSHYCEEVDMTREEFEQVKYNAHTYRQFPKSGYSNRELYNRFAFVRKNGIDDIPEEDPAVFDKWITEHEFSDHDGEILGNVDLIPYKKNGKIYMKFFGRGRRGAETAIFLRTYLALIDAGFPMDINYLSFADELEGSDNIMIHPFGDDFDRGAQIELLPEEIKDGLINAVTWIEPMKIKLRK